MQHINDEEILYTLKVLSRVKNRLFRLMIEKEYAVGDEIDELDNHINHILISMMENKNAA